MSEERRRRGRETTPRGRLPISVLAACLALSPACRSTPVHRAGEQQTSVRTLVGDPTPGKRLAWNSEGDAPTVSVAAFHHWFVTDRTSVGAGVTGTHFAQGEQDVFAGELQGALRWHFAESGDTSYFWDLNGGVFLATDPVPANSTSRNYSFDFGPGLEVPIGETLRLIGGFEFHHISNALGRESKRNESQNELRYWVGLAWAP